MSEKTKRLVESEAETILQPKFQTGRLTCTCDILKRVEDNIFHLFEIKSTTSVKPEHKHGLAFQTLLLETCGLEIRGIGVIHVDRNYVREKEIDPTGISKLKEVTTQVREKIEDTKEKAKQATEVIEAQSMPDPFICSLIVSVISIIYLKTSS
ncbi:MAG: Dna2/Cas4 domain-containing protein [Candidatus Magasanikbacteria bacterium]